MRHNALAIALTAGLLLSSGLAYGGDRALLVGVNDYNDPAWSDLNGTVKDVANVRRLLIEDLAFPEDGIMQLTDAQATRAAILAAIETWLIDGTERGDRVFFYFSGHGTDVEIPVGQEVRHTSGLAPSDVSSGVALNAPTVGGLILGAQLGELVRRMEGRDVTIIADACQSASLIRGSDGTTQDVEGIRSLSPFRPLRLDPADVTDEVVAQSGPMGRFLDINTEGGSPVPGVAVWSATRREQLSWDSPEGGIFTQYFVEGLRSRKAAFSDDGRVTASSLLSYIRENTTAFCSPNPRCSPLGFVPQILASEPYMATIMLPYSPGATLLAGDGADALQTLADGLFSHENDFALKVDILPGPEVSLGDAVKFRIESDVAGRLVVLDKGADGKLRRIFPNEYSEAVGKDGVVAAGRPLTIPDESYPFTFTATDAGPGNLIVLVAESNADFDPLLDSDDFEPVEDAERALVAVAADLLDPPFEPDGVTIDDARKWAYVTVPYNVSE